MVQMARVLASIASTIRRDGLWRVYFGLKEELVGISLKGGLRWMVKPSIDGWFLRMMVRRVAA